jgi:hypothetical protein
VRAKSRIAFGENETRQYDLQPEDGDKRIRADKSNVVVYDRDVYDLWRRKEDEQFLEDFTVDKVDEMLESPQGYLMIRQVLFLVVAKHLLRDVPLDTLRHANKKAFPELKKHFVNFSPVRQQIKKRLEKDYKRGLQQQVDTALAHDPNPIVTRGTYERGRSEPHSSSPVLTARYAMYAQKALNPNKGVKLCLF